MRSSSHRHVPGMTDNSSKATNPFRNMPEMSGIRGVAISVVVLGHVYAHSSAARYLFVSPVLMDLFFMYSAFFISRIFLFTDISVRNIITFYKRRAWRIWPLYYVVTVACLGIEELSHVLDVGPGNHHGWLDWLRFLTFLQFTPGYGEYYADNSEFLLTHTWSLAIEEQFYLLWPPLLVAIVLRPRLGLLLLLLMVPLAILARSNGVASHLLLARMDTFAIGTFLAYTTKYPVAKLGPWTINWKNIWTGLFLGGAVVCLILALALYQHMPAMVTAEFSVGFDYNQKVAFVFRLMLGGLAGWVWFTASHPAWFLMRARPLVIIGTLTYPIYLLHMPILLLVTPALQLSWEASPTEMGIVIISLTAAVSYLWHRFVDIPIEQRRKRLKYQPVSLQVDSAVDTGRMLDQPTMASSSSIPGEASPQISGADAGRN